MKVRLGIVGSATLKGSAAQAVEVWIVDTRRLAQCVGGRLIPSAVRAH
ncbi:MAG TPA: hypothetical protein VEJ87_08070 [Acidimicrobiales bacterium]|nr:hypothetical protein [Acidimicrobiales bacterium]